MKNPRGVTGLMAKATAALAIGSCTLLALPASPASAADYSAEAQGSSARFAPIVEGGSDGRLTISTTKTNPKVGDRITVQVEYAPMVLWDLFPAAHNKEKYQLTQDLVRIWSTWQQYITINGKFCPQLDSAAQPTVGASVRSTDSKVSSGWWPLDVAGAAEWSTGVVKRIVDGRAWQMRGSCSFTVTKDMGDDLTVEGITKRSNLFTLLKSQSNGVGDIPVAARGAAQSPEILTPLVGDTVRPGSGSFEGVAPANKVVALYQDGKLVGSVKSDADGYWKIPVTDKFAQGSAYFQAQVKGDSADDESKKSDGVRATVGASATALKNPAINPVSGTLKPGDVITGTAAPGDTVTLNGPDGVFGIPTVVGAKGTWSIAVPEGTESGTMQITAVASQDGHDRSSRPLALTVSAGDDATASKDPVINAGQGSVKQGGKLSGTAEPGAAVTVKTADGKTVGEPVTAGSDGTWSAIVPKDAAVGAVTLVAVASKDGKDRTSKPVKVTVSADENTTPPKATPTGEVSNVVLLPGKQANIDFKLNGFEKNTISGAGSNGVAFVAPSGATWTGVLTLPGTCGNGPSNIDANVSDSGSVLKPKGAVKWCGSDSPITSPAFTARLQLGQLTDAEFDALKVGDKLGSFELRTNAGTKKLDAAVAIDAR